MIEYTTLKHDDKGIANLIKSAKTIYFINHKH